jgi:hypothetical protein
MYNVKVKEKAQPVIGYGVRLIQGKRNQSRGSLYRNPTLFGFLFALSPVVLAPLNTALCAYGFFSTDFITLHFTKSHLRDIQ